MAISGLQFVERGLQMIFVDLMSAAEDVRGQRVVGRTTHLAWQFARDLEQGLNGQRRKDRLLGPATCSR